MVCTAVVELQYPSAVNVAVDLYSGGCDGTLLRRYAVGHRVTELVLDRFIAFRRVHALSGHRQVVAVIT